MTDHDITRADLLDPIRTAHHDLRSNGHTPDTLAVTHSTHDALRATLPTSHQAGVSPSVLATLDGLTVRTRDPDAIDGHARLTDTTTGHATTITIPALGDD